MSAGAPGPRPALVEGVALLERLLAATPEPPAGDDDPDTLLAAFAEVAAARAVLLDELAALAAGPEAPPRALVDALATREHAWTAALARVRDLIGARLVSIRRLRAL